MKNKIAVIALLMVSVTIGTLFPKIVLTYQDKIYKIKLLHMILTKRILKQKIKF